jgi:hypothetical protein
MLLQRCANLFNDYLQALGFTWSGLDVSAPNAHETHLCFAALASQRGDVLLACRLLHSLDWTVRVGRGRVSTERACALVRLQRHATALTPWTLAARQPRVAYVLQAHVASALI